MAQTSSKLDIRSIIGVIIVLVVGLALIEVVVTSVASAYATLSGTAAILVNLIPIFYVIALLLAVIKWATS